MLPKMWKTLLLLVSVHVMLLQAELTHAACAMAPANAIPNPISVCTIEDLINAVATQIVTFGSVAAAIAIIVVGFRLVVASASGNQGEIAQAKKMLGWVLTGTAIVVGAGALASAVVNTIKTL